MVKTWILMLSIRYIQSDNVCPIQVQTKESLDVMDFFFFDHYYGQRVFLLTENMIYYLLQVEMNLLVLQHVIFHRIKKSQMIFWTCCINMLDINHTCLVSVKQKTSKLWFFNFFYTTTGCWIWQNGLLQVFVLIGWLVAGEKQHTQQEVTTLSQSLTDIVYLPLQLLYSNVIEQCGLYNWVYGDEVWWTTTTNSLITSRTTSQHNTQHTMNTVIVTNQLVRN